MTQIAITANGAQVISARAIIPWLGNILWDLEIALTATQISTFALVGPIAIQIGAVTYKATIDPLRTGVFADRVFISAIGGGGGWATQIAGKQYHDAGGGLLSTVVYADTAGGIGETVSDPTPQTFGLDFARIAGPASAVFGDRDWYVDPVSGVTIVASWPSATADASATITRFDPSQQIAHMTCDVLLVPGTVLSDPRFNGRSPVVRTVEQTFNEHGSHVTAYCSVNPVERLSEAFTIAVRQAADTAHLKVYQYRFVLTPSGTDLALQAITPGAPDLNPIAQYQMLSGASNTYKPSTIILVGFTGDNPPQPYLVTASPLAIPVVTNVDGSTVNVGTEQASQVNVGSLEAQVSLAGGTNALVPTPWAAAIAAGLAAVAAALSGNPSTEPAAATAATAIDTMLAGLPSDATTNTKAT